MLVRILFLLFFGIVNLVANIENVELLADDVKKDGDIIIANKNVVVYSQTYLVTADRAIYDLNSSIIELFGNVNMMKGASETSRSNYAKINLKSDESSFEALFMMNKDLEVWLKSDESSSDTEYYRTKGAVVSSCNVQDPDWSISSSTALLNRQSKFLHMFNPVFRISNVPVFYLPYFGFSTDTTRRTGLLPPEIGYGKLDGFYYKQPIYFAPYNEWDFELDPQIRTHRGAGIYGSFRFADSPYSDGEIGFGSFYDRSSYRNRQARKNSNNQTLKNNSHKGIEFRYQRDRLLKQFFDDNLQEGLWVEAVNLNDIDYLNLKGRDDDFDSLVTSKLNYFLSSQDHYFGAYAKYYIDTKKLGSKNENKDTLQEYPSFQYHKFTDTLLLPNLLYSIDLQSHRYDRKIGVKATQYELNAPISFHIPFFDDSLTFSFYENLYATHINYGNKATSQINKNTDDNNYFVNNYHRFTLHTDLAKAYDNFFHTINLGAEYIIPGLNRGDLSDKSYYDLVGNEYENFLANKHTKEEALAYLTQYFYAQSGRKVLRHSISQGYYAKDGDYSNLKNTIAFYPTSNLSIYNKLEYSHIDNKFRTVQSGLTYSSDDFETNIWHTLKRNDETKYSYITTAGWTKLPYNNRIHGAWQYDFERDNTKLWRIGFSHIRKCWNYGITYQRDIEPATTKSGSAAKKTDGFYFTINFYPMGGIHYDFSISKDTGKSFEQ